MITRNDHAVNIHFCNLLTSYQIYPVIAACTIQLTQDAQAPRLVAGCELWDVLSPSKPTRKMVLACPGVDAIRLWSLPCSRAGGGGCLAQVSGSLSAVKIL